MANLCEQDNISRKITKAYEPPCSGDGDDSDPLSQRLTEMTALLPFIVLAVQGLLLPCRLFSSRGGWGHSSLRYMLCTRWLLLWSTGSVALGLQ